MRISKARLTEWSALKHKKNRDATGLFLLEGEKIVREYLDSGKRARSIVATLDWFEENPVSARACEEVYEATENDLEKLSSLKTPSRVVAVARVELFAVDEMNLDGSLTLVLDGVQDPGNLGTLLRLADWFGIRNVVCSLQTADWTNPKVVQASMGSFLRVRCVYVPLETWIPATSQRWNLPVYGTFLQGENVYRSTLTPRGLIVMGNEGGGISPAVAASVTQRLTIPRAAGSLAESLNVATAASIVLSEFLRTTGEGFDDLDRLP